MKNVFIKIERNKIVLYDAALKTRFANEYFKSFDEATQFCDSNNLTLITIAVKRTMKKFFWKDKSGRGFTNTFTLDGLKKALKGERSWDDEAISKWAKDAEEGAKWENAANEVTCVNS